MEPEPERRSPQLHARTLATRRAELVDDRILDDLRRIERVRQKRVVDRGIDPQRVGDLQLLRPVDLLHRVIERVGGVDAKPSERLEHSDRRAALEHRPVESLLLSPGSRRELDRPPTDAEVLCPHTLQLLREDPLEAFERPRGHPRRLVKRRRRQRPGGGRHCGKSHHVHHALDRSKVTASPRILRP